MAIWVTFPIDYPTFQRGHGWIHQFLCRVIGELLTTELRLRQDLEIVLKVDHGSAQHHYQQDAQQHVTTSAYKGAYYTDVTPQISKTSFSHRSDGKVSIRWYLLSGMASQINGDSTGFFFCMRFRLATKKTSSCAWMALCVGNPPVTLTKGIHRRPSQRVSKAVSISRSWRHHLLENIEGNIRNTRQRTVIENASPRLRPAPIRVQITSASAGWYDNASTRTKYHTEVKAKPPTKPEEEIWGRWGISAKEVFRDFFFINLCVNYTRWCSIVWNRIGIRLSVP